MASQHVSVIIISVIACVLGLLLNKYIHYIKCEDCDENWIELDIKGLEEDFTNKLFGQHIASEVIIKALKGSASNPNPQKPLTMSLHGYSGTGKNFVSRLIAQNLYRKGLDSKYVHMFVSTLHFPHVQFIDQYQSNLRGWIHGNVSQCARSMFIFDEMDKMHPGLINAIKPFLEYSSVVDKVDYRKAIFIFLSNTGGDKISEFTLNILMNGKERESIKLSQLEEELSSTVFNNSNSGFWQTALIQNNLIDHFIPFLPLEFKHVESCVRAEIASRGKSISESIVSTIASNMVYYPEEKLLSLKGCKTVASKVNLYF
ncbi:torsin-1A-like [Hemiscyllium ocellatum]|uniref:torsin-1A-like n=1 Tax=Hemiscyllium ocellatum TaxID=170820 RepID=UPI002966B4D1|nr:torsin-1A-like [Hemiscyllium ocellatum]XP_060697118.1 torsin-1A-like [Hemiscyllium ocellatum]